VAIAANAWTHVAVRLSGNTATLYINGTVAGTNNNMTLRPSSLGNTALNYIGKSQFANDAALSGSVDDFRIYGRALAASDIAALAAQPRLAYVFNDRLYVDFPGASAAVALGASGSNVSVTSGATTFNFASSAFSDIVVTGTAGNDALTINATMPKPFAFAGEGGSDSLKVATGASVTFDSDLAQTASQLALEVDGAATFAAPQRGLQMLKVTGAASVAPGGGNVLRTAALDITGGGMLDLSDNVLIVDNGQLGTSDGSAYSGVQGLVQQGSRGGAWDGAGVRTAMSDAQAGLTGLGVATGAQVRGLAAGETGLFAGQTISADSVIVMYTYVGDANLDGQITGDDYSAIDFNIAVPGASGWYNGDFNYDGIVSGDDYSSIDYNILAQGAPFSTAAAARPQAEPTSDKQNEDDSNLVSDVMP
jgi:hypothetical protein